MGLPTIIELTQKDIGSDRNDLDLRIDVYGSGYRSAFFHTGALWRLEELGLLACVKIIARPQSLSFLSAIALREASRLWIDQRSHDYPFRKHTPPAACRAIFNAIGNVSRNSLKQKQPASSAAVEPNRPTQLALYWGAHWTGLLESEHISQVRLETDLSQVLECQAFTSGDAVYAKLSRIPDDFMQLDRITQEYLTDWGYAVCEASLPRTVRQDQKPPFASPNRLLYFKIERKLEVEAPVDSNAMTAATQKSQTQEEIPHMSLPGAA